MDILQKRGEYYSNTTISKIYINGEFFCWGLEDTVRPELIKVIKYTAIPQNLIGYSVGRRYSPSFKRNMVILYTEDDKVTINLAGLIFKYVYSHGGNGPEDTEGCIIVAYNRKDDRVWGTAEKDLADKIFSALDKGEKVTWAIVNLPQTH